jgi:hypothetical protein
MVTGYSRLSARHARAVLAILALGTVYCLEVASSPLWQGNVERFRPGAGDPALYRAEVDRIHNGQSYYQAAAAELTSRGYPTLSVFNWRTPLPMWFIGRLPRAEWAKYLLGALSLGLIIIAFEALARDQNIKGDSLVFADPESMAPKKIGHFPYIGLGCVLLLSGPLLFNVLGDLFVMPILWAGVLIAISLCAYGTGRPILGLGLGLAALFIRELALPYCLLCASLAAIKCFPAGERGANEPPRCIHRGLNTLELIGWGLGLCAWLIFFGWHCWNVSGLIGPDAIAHKLGWIRFGGAGFVLATAQMNAYLILLPPWVTALYFAAAIFGLAGWHTALGVRMGLTTCLYLMFFAVVGQDFNQYWGSLITPLLCFGIVRFPASMRDLCQAAGISAGKRRKFSTT